MTEITAKSFGWNDKEFKEIIDEVLAYEKDVIVSDISSPPGTGKTKNTIRYIVERRNSLIASFPTHANQEQALEYLIEALEEEKPKKLPFFVLDYGGLENYCIFYKPEVLMKFLDKFKTDANQSYVEAVEEFLGNHFISAILFQRALNNDDIWYRIGEILDEYKKTNNKRKYISSIKEIVEKKGQYEICRGVCPIGLMFWYYRRNIYHDLANPKIITWRKKKVEELKRKNTETGKHILLANPSETIDNFDELLNGKYKIENVLCPRLLLISPSSLTKKNKTNYIAVRKSIILTPHASLQFVTNVIKREHDIQKINPRHILYLDEYDTLLKPKKWNLYSISTLTSLIAIADMIIKKRVGESIDGIYIDEYLYQYAKYVRNVAKRVYDVVTNSINTKKYHPIVNLFVEGAMSTFEETTLKINLTPNMSKLIYKPLATRPVHIRYFLGSDLLSLIISEKTHFQEFIDDPEWRVNLRTAKINFDKLTSNIPVHEYSLFFIKTPRGKEILLGRRKNKRNIHKIIEDLREYLRPLIDYPRFAVFYNFDGNQIILSSIDISIYNILQLRGILTSASPIKWDFVVNGPRHKFGNSLYANLVLNSVVSTILVNLDREEEYFDKVIDKYNVIFNAYDTKTREKIEKIVYNGGKLPDTINIEHKNGIIKQISILTKMNQEYSKLLHIIYVPLPTLYMLPKELNYQDEKLALALLEKSLEPYSSLISFHLSFDKVKDRYILLLVQNKFYARVFANNVRAIKCYKNKCDNNIKKITHFSNPKLKIDITWFRSRAERGIDLPNNYRMVVVVGSPYPKPSFIAQDVVEPSELTTSIAQSTTFLISSFNTKTINKVSIAHIPYDILSAISELTQAIGRATRSAMREMKPVKVIIPAFLRNKIYVYSPLWLKMD